MTRSAIERVINGWHSLPRFLSISLWWQRSRALLQWMMKSRQLCRTLESFKKEVTHKGNSHIWRDQPTIWSTWLKKTHKEKHDLIQADRLSSYRPNNFKINVRVFFKTQSYHLKSMCHYIGDIPSCSWKAKKKSNSKASARVWGRGPRYKLWGMSVRVWTHISPHWVYWSGVQAQVGKETSLTSRQTNCSQCWFEHVIFFFFFLFVFTRCRVSLVQCRP